MTAKRSSSTGAAEGMGSLALVIGHSADLLTVTLRAADPGGESREISHRSGDNQMNAEDFNKKFPIGSDVIYTDDFGNEHKTKTRSDAWTLGSGHAVVCLEGRSGGYDINRIKAA
jgi:hypothetical protein